jgi:hypothetical protein
MKIIDVYVNKILFRDFFGIVGVECSPVFLRALMGLLICGNLKGFCKCNYYNFNSNID